MDPDLDEESMSQKVHKRHRNQASDLQRAKLIRPEPRNRVQLQYQNALENTPLTLAFGPAGTGKTYIAAATAAYLYLTGQADYIRMSRPKVEFEGHGYLPGKLEKKLEPLLLPVIEVLEECLGVAVVRDLTASGQITMEPFDYLRGRTLKNSFVILDEAQNVTEHQMRLFVTRIGENSKVLLNGDVTQSDIRKASGLSWCLYMVRKYGIDSSVVEFTSDHVERSDICRQWVQAMEAEDSNSPDARPSDDTGLRRFLAA